jgi:hypothetical protein
MDGTEEGNRPPAPLAVARRALILSGVVCRAFLEQDKDEDGRRETAARIQEWFDELGLWPHLEPREEKAIRAPFGKRPRRLHVEGTWFVEGLVILAWALRRGDFPPHDRKVDPFAVTDALDFLSPAATRLLAAPRLRGHAELEAAREWFYDVHCALRGFLHHGGSGKLATWIGQYLALLGIEPQTVMGEGHLLLDGEPVGDASPERLEGWECVVSERHRASIWLAGEYPLYTELPVDT